MKIVQTDDDDWACMIQHIFPNKVEESRALERFTTQICISVRAHIWLTEQSSQQLFSNKERNWCKVFFIPGRKPTVTTVFKQMPTLANSVSAL